MIFDTIEIKRKRTNPFHFAYGMFLVVSEWTKVSDVYCTNREEHSTKLKFVTECQRLCPERDDCIGVAFSVYNAVRYGSSFCYFCADAVTTSNVHYDFYLMPGNQQWIVFSFKIL